MIFFGVLADLTLVRGRSDVGVFEVAAFERERPRVGSFIYSFGR